VEQRRELNYCVGFYLGHHGVDNLNLTPFSKKTRKNNNFAKAYIHHVIFTSQEQSGLSPDSEVQSQS